MTETIDTKKKAKQKFKSGQVEIIWDKRSGEDEFEFRILGHTMFSCQAQGIKDLMNCLVELTKEFKKEAEESK